MVLANRAPHTLRGTRVLAANQIENLVKEGLGITDRDVLSRCAMHTIAKIPIDRTRWSGVQLGVPEPRRVHGQKDFLHKDALLTRDSS